MWEYSRIVTVALEVRDTGLKWLLFKQNHFSWDLKHKVDDEQDDWLIQIKVVHIVLIDFEIYMNNLFIIKVTIFVLIEWLYMSTSPSFSPQLCRVWNLE